MFSHSFINVHIDSYSHFVQKHRSCTCCVAKKQSDLNEHRTRDPIATLPILLALQSSCRVFQDFFLIITYHHFRTYQHESTDYCPNMHPFFFRNKCSVQVVFKLIFVAFVTFVTSPTDGHLSTLSQNWRPCRCIRRPMVIVITILQLYLLKNELEKPSLRPRLSRLMFNLDIPLYFHGNTVLIVVILVFRDARVMPVIQG